MLRCVVNIAQRLVDIDEEITKLKENEMKAPTGDEKYTIAIRRVALMDEGYALRQRQAELQTRKEAFSTPYKDQQPRPSSSSSSSVVPLEGESTFRSIWQRLMFFFSCVRFV